MLFWGGGIKRIRGRSKSILSSDILSLQALIHCCQCPLTDVFVQRSGPSSHAPTTPPDTQQTQQQQNKQGYSLMPKPIASLSAIPSSLHPSIYPSTHTSLSLLIDFALVTLYHQPNWQLPPFVWEESQAKLQASHQMSPIDCGLVLWQVDCTGKQLWLNSKFYSVYPLLIGNNFNCLFITFGK